MLAFKAVDVKSIHFPIAVLYICLNGLLPRIRFVLNIDRFDRCIFRERHSRVSVEMSLAIATHVNSIRYNGNNRRSPIQNQIVVVYY